MPDINLDATDIRILNELQRDARLTNVELAARVNLSASPCLARVRRLETEGLIGTQPEMDALKQQVEKAFALPEVARWFDGTMQLYNECPILTQEYYEETGKYGTYRPDRVMFGKDEITVVDFKFGRPHDEYRDQVGGYMKQLRLMEPDRRVKGYLWYILNNRLEEVQV